MSSLYLWILCFEVAILVRRVVQVGRKGGARTHHEEFCTLVSFGEENAIDGSADDHGIDRENADNGVSEEETVKRVVIFRDAKIIRLDNDLE